MAKRKLPIPTAVVALAIIGLALSLTTFAAITASPPVSSNGTVSTSPPVSSNGTVSTSPPVSSYGTVPTSPPVSSYGTVPTSPPVSSNGAVPTSANCGLYSDSACTTPLSSISWGTLTIGGTTTQTIYVKNTCSDLSLTLSMTTSSWSPASANGPITITWDKEGTRLSPGQSTTATLTLTVSSSIADITSFNVQISITGTN